MISNEKMEKLWWQYKNEGVAKNLSLQAFCSIHNVPYNAFEKYLKLRRHFSDVHYITVTGLPEQTGDIPEEAIEPESISGATEAVASTATITDGPERVRIMIHIRMSNGMQVSRKNKDYRELRDLVGKLEICRIKL